MIDIPTQESFDARRQRLLAASLAQTAVVISAVTIIYAIAELRMNSDGFRAAALPYALLLTVPWFAAWLARGPLCRHAEAVALSVDAFYTAVLAVLLLQPTTTLSGAALFFTLKMVATALFFPWKTSTQCGSAGMTLLVYWGAVLASGRPIEASAGLHQLLGPLIAAVFSVAGAQGAEGRRRALFDNSVELASAAEKLESLLVSVRDSEKQLRRQQAEQQIMFDSVPAMIWYKDAHNRILRANRAAAEATGLSVDELEGRSTFELYPDEAEKYHRDDLEVITSRQAKRGIVESLQTADKGKRWVQTDKVPYKDEAGNVVGVVVFAVDVTERLSAEEALASSARLLEDEVEVSTALARVGQDLISALDTPLVLDRLCRLTMETLECDFTHVLRLEGDSGRHELVSGAGFTPTEWEALRLMPVPNRALAAMLRELERTEVVQLDVAHLRPSLAKEVASQYGVAFTVSAALRRGGHIFGVLTAAYRRERAPFAAHEERIVRGIAQLASLALQNAQLVEELARANGIKSEFVATMSHELRTPLNVITGYGSLLLDGEFGEVTEEQTTTLVRVLKSADELLELINATLDLSRLESGRVAIDVQAVSLLDLFEELRSDAEERVKPNVCLDWQVETNLPLLRTDPIKLKVIVKNLVANAIKFTEAGSISVRAHSVNGGVEIRVADTGIGIAPELLPVIFEAFRQADSSTTRHYGGVGLGLYIVQRLLALLHGSVSVESTSGQGTTFRVWVPTDLEHKSAA